MLRKGYSPEQIVAILRQADVELSKGHTTAQICKRLGIAEQTDCRWRRECGDLSVDQARRLKELEGENT